MIKTRELLRSIRQNKFIAVSAALIILIAAAFLLLFNGKSQNITIERSKGKSDEINSKAVKDKEKESVVMYVDVDGCVVDPGVYELRSGSRVFEAIDKAGGLKGSADTSGINQAEVVKDGQKIFIPKKGSGNTANKTGNNDLSKEGSSGKININTADSEELQSIVGIGPVTADKIIDYRENNGNFDKIEDIKNVSGIGDKTFEKMAKDICV